MSYAITTTVEQPYDTVVAQVRAALADQGFGDLTDIDVQATMKAKLNADIVRAMRSPDGQKKMEDAGFRVTGTSQQDFAKTIAADTVTWGKAVAATGFKAD